MHLAADYIHPFEGPGGFPSKCRIRLYIADEEGGNAPVVICSELPDNTGTPITNAAEYIAAEVITRRKLPRPVWIEHYPSESRGGGFETWSLVTFESYEVEETPFYLGGGRVSIGVPRWSSIDRRTVESLVGGEVGL